VFNGEQEARLWTKSASTWRCALSSRRSASPHSGNLALRAFLKEVGVTSQREIEKIVREHAPQAGVLRPRMALTSPDVPELNHVIEDAIPLALVRSCGNTAARGASG
jgi:Family of unknown function (DUF6494)